MSDTVTGLDLAEIEAAASDLLGACSEAGYRECVDILVAAAPALLAAARAVQRVRALHVPYDCTAAGEEGHETCMEREWCYSCPEELGWPCPTVIALDGE